MSKLRINEVFYSLQGEGVRAGTANVFVRFTGCNLACNGTIEGEAYAPVCDTEFMSGVSMTPADLLAAVEGTDAGGSRNVIFTGGEPSSQLSDDLVVLFKSHGYHLAIETNGTQQLPVGLDWVTVSPKTAEHTLAVTEADEVKYVRCAGQGIPKTRVQAEHYLISPAFDGSGRIPPETLQWCIKLVKENPKWRLSVQQHKNWSVR